ncbi:MAG TPA: hypothetical protein VFP05_02265 [Thermomicrobiales bacterium]|nr:hypothetical protein [Thermomicrobiales bacterium]
MAKRGRLCVVPECGRHVTPGALVCAEHRETALGRELGREVAALTASITTLERADQEHEKREAARNFRQEVMRGQYAALFSSTFDAMLADSGKEHDLTEEIGMLKIAMRRVLTEEEQPTRMAHGLAKLSGALGRAIVLQEAREQSAGTGEESQIIATLNQMMVDLEKESRINRTPWTVDPYNPPKHVARELERHRLEPGSPEAVLWVEQWRYWLTKKRADDGFEDAREALAEGLVEVHGELGDGLPKRRGSIDTGSGFGDKGWTT